MAVTDSIFGRFWVVICSMLMVIGGILAIVALFYMPYAVFWELPAMIGGLLPADMLNATCKGQHDQACKWFWGIMSVIVGVIVFYIVAIVLLTLRYIITGKLPTGAK